MSDYPKCPGLGDPVFRDPDTIVERQYLGKIPPRYSFDRPTYRFRSRTFAHVGTAGFSADIDKAKKFYASHGLRVRAKKYEAKSYGRYWAIYVGKGVWREYTSHYRSG